MRADAGECVEIFEQIVEARGEPDMEDRDLADYLELSERCANDPDAPQPDRYHALMRKYAVQGAIVGLNHGAPVLISVDRTWLAAASGEQA